MGGACRWLEGRDEAVEVADETVEVADEDSTNSCGRRGCVCPGEVCAGTEVFPFSAGALPAKSPQLESKFS